MHQNRTTLPPHDDEAERGVIGAVMLKPDTLDEVALIVKPVDFYSPQLATLYATLLELHNDGSRIDVTLLNARLKKNGVLEQVGGRAHLAELFQSCPTAAHAAYYARIVREAAIRRSVLYAGGEIQHFAADDGADADDLLNRTEQLIYKIRDTHTLDGDRVSTATELMHAAFADIDARCKKKVPAGMRTGFVDLDQFITFSKGSLNILAARTSVGKTAFATQLALKRAEAGEKVLFVSLEMNQLEIATRLIAAHGKVDTRRMASGNLTERERMTIVESSGAIAQLKLWIDDSPNRSVNEIAAVARRIRRQSGLDMIVVDYLQRVKPDNPKDPRHEQVSRISDRLKGVARELDLPIICLAQLNRQAADAKDKPRLAHLRESGAIEQDADVVLFLHRVDYETAQAPATVSEVSLIVAKNRNGATGEIALTWFPPFNRYESCARARQATFD